MLWCLFSPRPFPSKDVLLSEALSVMALPLAGPNHLLEASTERYFRLLASPCVSLRLIPPSSPVISRYLTQSHPIASYRTAGLAERLNFAAWTRFLGRPASRLATADVRLPCRIQVSTVFDILTLKGRAQPVTGQAPPLSPKERIEISYAPSRRMSSAWRASSSPTVCCILAW